MLVLMLLLFHKGRKHHRSMFLAIYAFVEVLTNGLNMLTLNGGYAFFDEYPYLHFIYKPLYCLWVPLFYFYARSSLAPDSKWNKKYFFHLIPFFTYLFWIFGVWIVGGNTYLWESLYREGSLPHITALSVDVVVKIQYLVYNFLLVKQLILLEKNRNNASALRIHWLRFIVYGYALGCLGQWCLFLAMYLFPSIVPQINIVTIAYFFLFFFFIFYDTITQKPFEKIDKKKAVPENRKELEKWMEKVDEEVNQNKLYLDPELNLGQIAMKLNAKERAISQAINTINGRNVKDYLNMLRTEYACKLLCEDRHKPIYEVMYESGFNTKGAFNLTFKKITGKTPTAFREDAQEHL